VSKSDVSSAMRPLSTYRSKRDFARTAEPAGRVSRRRGKLRRFVIQRHDATRLHYDLRLELGGVYKSWAVTKVPSPDPAVKRLAVEVEDHPVEYGTFEGVIPEGEYGGGTVQLWDRGSWTPEGTGSPESALAKGHIKFALEGERMKGGWALIRMKDKPPKGRGKLRHNWLLIKEKDAAAQPNRPDALLAEDTSVKSGRTLAEIASGKKTRIWHSKPRNKATPDIGRSAPMPKFVAPQLCRIVPVPPNGADWVHEIKFDGYRVQMRVEGGKARLRTRRGLDWTRRFPEIAKEGDGLPDCLIDGEIVALDGKGVADFAALQQALSQGKTAGLVFFVFDALFADGRDLRGEGLPARKEALKGLLSRHAKKSSRLRFVAHFSSGGEEALNAACRLGLEGVVSKRLEAPYRSGRGDAWTKSKCRAGQEVVIGGWWGDGATLRSLLVGAFRDGRFIYLGRIGTGFKPGPSRALLAKLKAMRRATSPFSDAPAATREVHWVDPKLVAEVEIGSVTRAGLLRQASFKGLREDKSARSVVPEPQPKHKGSDMPQQSAKTGKEHREIAGLVITHPDKIMWPAAKPDPAFTKFDLATYYEAFADRILLHVAGRPLSLVRAPDGIDGPRFFQRHANRQAIKARPIKVKGEPEPYLAIEDVAGLVSLAQAAVLELHPWGAKKNEPDVPERVIFDLDPAPDVAFERVIAAAKELRERLMACGLEPFVKTTGGKGIHVVVAIKGSAREPATWPETKDFARRISMRMAADSPDIYTVTMAKKARTGRIFIDYLRNDRTATAVAPWSPRARPHAPIATPLEWAQLKKGLDPLAFTLRTAMPLLKRADPWGDLHKSAAALAAARRALEKADR
jgi:bifunctional non-homologous end joining protein LigD